MANSNCYIILWLFTFCMLTSICASNVTVTCVSCSPNSSTLQGPLGGEITIKYHVNAPKFIDMTISYNKTQEIVFSPSVLNKKGVRDRRFIIPDNVLKESDGTVSIEFTLTNLSAGDSGAIFRYQYHDDDFYRWHGSNKLIVTGSVHITPSHTTSPPLTTAPTKKVPADENLLFIVIGVLAMLILCVLILTVVCCYYQWRRGHNGDPEGSKPLYSVIEMDDRRTEVPAYPHGDYTEEEDEEIDDVNNGYLHPIDSNEESDTVGNNKRPVPLPVNDLGDVHDTPVNVESNAKEASHEYEYIDTTELVKQTDTPQVTPSTSRKKFEACAIDTSGGKFADYVQTGKAVYKQPSSVPKFNPPHEPPSLPRRDSDLSTPLQSDLTDATQLEADTELPAFADRFPEAESLTLSDPGSEHSLSPHVSTESPLLSPDSDTSALDSTALNDTAVPIPSDSIVLPTPPCPIYASVHKEPTIYEAPHVAPSEYESLNTSPSPLATDIYLQLE